MIRALRSRPAVAGLAVTAALLAPLAVTAAPAAARATTSPLRGPGASLARVAVILVDTNTSLAGRGIMTERAAVLAYTRALPPEVRVGLVSFGAGWRTDLWPTASRRRFAQALRSLRISGATSRGISGALARAGAVLRAMAATAHARLVVFSDGENLTGHVPAAIVPTDVVAWAYERGDNARAVRALAWASGGHTAGLARAAALAAAFPPPARPPRAHPAPSSRSATPTERAALPAARSAAARLRWSWQLAAALAAVFAAVLLICLLAIGALHDQDRSRNLAGRIDQYGPRRVPSVTAPAGPTRAHGRVAGAAVRWVTRLLQARGAEQGLARRLDLAGIGRKPAEWVLLGACACVIIAAALTAAVHNVVLGVLLGTVTGWLGMRAALSVRIGRRRAAFSEQLPDLLQLLAGSLQSGFSLAQALDTVVREDSQPASGEFSRALAEARLGADLEDGLDGVVNRMDSSDLRWTVMAIRIQHEVGGNLSEVLRNIVGTMRERAYLRRQVKALSAEGRLSAYILVALPVVIGGWLFYSSGHYMRPLYTTPVGLLMLGGAGVLVVLGALWMRALINVEV